MMTVIMNSMISKHVIRFSRCSEEAGWRKHLECLQWDTEGGALVDDCHAETTTKKGQKCRENKESSKHVNVLGIVIHVHVIAHSL